MYVDTSAEALFLDQYEPTVSWGSRFPFELSAGGAASFYLVLWGGFRVFGPRSSRYF